MTKIALILGIHVGGLVFAVLLARWLSGRDAGSTDVRRVAGAVERASDAFLWQEFRLVGAVAGALAVTSFGLHALRAHAAPLGRIEAAFWASVGLLLGAAGACVVAQMAVRLAQRASLRAVAASRSSLDRALVLGMRAGGAAGLFVETLSATGLLFLFGLLFAMKGGAHATGTDAGALVAAIAGLLPGYALGAAAAALILQRAGATYHAAADVAADVAGENDAGLEHDDARNPAVVADLVGDHVGPTAGRVVDSFVASTAANVTAVAVGLAVYAAGGGGPEALALALLPVVARAFGVIASAFGVMVVRTDEQHGPAAALWRGHASTAVISLGGLAGATIWLGGEHWQRFFTAGALGVGAAAIAAYAARWRIDRRLAPQRELGESIKTGHAGAVAQGLGVGLESALVATAAMGLAMVGAWQLGVSTGVGNGGLLGSFTALMTMLASTPYVLALGTFGSIADNARGVAAMSAATLEETAQRRAGRLDDAGFVAMSVAQTYLIAVGCLTALSAVAALPLLGASGGATLAAFSANSAARIDLAKPVVIWSGALGFAAVLAYAGNAARAAARGARGVALEVERQLRGFPKLHGMAQVPKDYTPSYRACIEVVARSALERVLPTTGAALLLPILLGVAVLLVYRRAEPGMVVEALAAFVAIAAVTGLAAALAVDGARAALAAARRLPRPRGSGGGFSAALTGDAVGDVIGNSAGPAAHLLVKAVAVAALAAAPFLT